VWQPEIPRVWVDQDMAELEVPLADAAMSPTHISADYYYQIPVLPIRKTYPVYAPAGSPWVTSSGSRHSSRKSPLTNHA
jgi:hypothetical protein